MSQVPSPFRPAPIVEEVIARAMSGHPAPRTLYERNTIQMALVAEARARFPDLNEIDALVTVSVLYAASYPDARYYGLTEDPTNVYPYPH